TEALGGGRRRVFSVLPQDVPGLVPVAGGGKLGVGIARVVERAGLPIATRDLILHEHSRGTVMLERFPLERFAEFQRLSEVIARQDHEAVAESVGAVAWLIGVGDRLALADGLEGWLHIRGPHGLPGGLGASAGEKRFGEDAVQTPRGTAVPADLHGRSDVVEAGKNLFNQER